VSFRAKLRQSPILPVNPSDTSSDLTKLGCFLYNVPTGGSVTIHTRITFYTPCAVTDSISTFHAPAALNQGGMTLTGMTSTSNDFTPAQYLGFSAVRISRSGLVNIDLSFTSIPRIRLLTPHFVDAASLTPVKVL